MKNICRPSWLQRGCAPVPAETWMRPPCPGKRSTRITCPAPVYTAHFPSGESLASTPSATKCLNLLIARGINSQGRKSILFLDGHEQQETVWRPILGSGVHITLQENLGRPRAIGGDLVAFTGVASRAVSDSLTVAGPQGIMLVADVGQAGAGATLQIDNA